MKFVFNKRQVVMLSAAVIFISLIGCAQPAISNAGCDEGSINIPDTQSSVQQTTANTAIPANTISALSVSAATVRTDREELTSISDILQNADEYDGKEVIVQGRIVNECGSGCWFTLREGNAVIYIDLAPNNMVIPQKRGAEVKVTGKVVKEGSDAFMIGSKVDF